MSDRKVEIGYTIPKERWKEASESLMQLGNILASSLIRDNKDGRGEADAAELMADITLACTALNYVAEDAVDKCRFIPIG